MVHMLVLGVSGVVLCGGMAFLADRLAADLFRTQEPAGQTKR